MRTSKIEWWRACLIVKATRLPYRDVPDRRALLVTGAPSSRRPSDTCQKAGCLEARCGVRSHASRQRTHRRSSESKVSTEPVMGRRSTINNSQPAERTTWWRACSSAHE